MNLVEQYARQYRWRSWQKAYEALPPLQGARVLDLGCGVGDQARDLAARGAQVMGLDGNAELIAHAQSRSIPGVEFHATDVRQPAIAGDFDGIWASFLPAYFPDFATVLSRWRQLLRPGGWIALTEVAGMFRHEPMAESARTLLDSYVSEALAAGRYDFDMGSKLAAHLSDAGFEVTAQRILPDQELSFSGCATPDVLEAWVERVRRMPRLQSLEQDLVRCLSSPSHATDCRVHFCVACRPT